MTRFTSDKPFNWLAQHTYNRHPTVFEDGEVRESAKTSAITIAVLGAGAVLMTGILVVGGCNAIREDDGPPPAAEPVVEAPTHAGDSVMPSGPEIDAEPLVVFAE